MDGAFRVGDWHVEPQLNAIAQGTRTIHVEPKVMKVLVYLADHANQVVGKERLINAVWADTFVSDDVLTHAVAELRRAFTDDAKAPRYIQTIPKGGYRLIAPLVREGVLQREGPVSARRRVAPTLVVLGGLTLIVALGAAGWLWHHRVPPTPARVMRLSISIPATNTLGAHRGNLLAFRLSPDGTRLVYVAIHEGKARLYLRALDEREAIPIPGTEGAFSPFFAPDGEWLGFAAGGRLKKVSLSDGSVIDLCDAPELRGAAFTPRGTIVFAPSYDEGLWQVPSGGGKPSELTKLDRQNEENTHRWPEVMPDGKNVMFTIRGGGRFENGSVASVDLATGERRILFDGGTFAQYVPTGHVVYGREAAMWAVPFDPIRLQVKGEPFRILDGIMAYRSTGAADFSFSLSGSVAYVARGAVVADRTLVWVDDRGLEQPILQARRGYDGPRLSPDGRRLAVTIIEGSNAGIWILDLARGALSRVTPETGGSHAIWHPSGSALTFAAFSSGALNLFSQPTDASQVPKRLTSSSYWQWPTSWSSNGRLLAYTETHPGTTSDIWILERDSGRRRPFTVSPALEINADFSPDGRWLAYVSDESGAQEVYVRPSQGGEPKWRISTDGGTQPVWDPDGGTLFYRNGDKMMAVAVATHPSFTAAKPRVLFEGRYRGPPSWGHTPSYDVARGGHRFVMIKDSERATPPTEIEIVLNWFDELTRQVPARGN